MMTISRLRKHGGAEFNKFWVKNLTCPAQDLQYRFRISTSAKIMTNDQLDQQVVELDNLNEHREIVTFMRRSSQLNTSQRTALEQYGHMIL